MRFDNGQLVDLNEKRKIAENFDMDDERSFTFLKECFRRMQRGQIAWLKIAESQHGRIYHSTNMKLQRTEEDRERMRTSVGPTIWIRVEITNIKRNPKCDTLAPLD